MHDVRVYPNFIDLHTAPTFPIPVAEETVFFPFYILDSLVEDSLMLGVWVYFWAVSAVPLIHMLVFVRQPFLRFICDLFFPSVTFEVLSIPSIKNLG